MSATFIVAVNIVMFSKCISYLLYNFNLWGFCVEFPEFGMIQKWTRIIFGVHLISTCFLCEFVWLFLHQVFYIEYDLISVLNDVVKFCLATFAYVSIVVESYCKHSVQQHFWKTYRRIRSDFDRPECKLTFRTYFIQFIQYFSITIFVEIKHIVKWFSPFLSFSYFGLMTMHEMRIFYYLFILRLLDHQLDQVGIEMELLVDASEKKTLSRNRLTWIRIYYDLVHELSISINEVFGWSNIINVLYLFLRVVFDSSWVYWRIHHKGRIELFSALSLFHLFLVKIAKCIS